MSARLTRPYQQTAVLAKLKEHGIGAVWSEVRQVGDRPVLSHLVANRDTHIGLKLWGYIDSLRVRLVREH